MNQALCIPTARVFYPLLGHARYKGARGGRGSGKSHFFAGLMIEEALATPGYRAVCVREIMRDLSESAKMLLEDKIDKFGVGWAFDCQRDRIVTPGDGVIIFRGMRDFNAESVKSLEGFDRAWVEEAQSLSKRSLSLLRPTIRKEGSQIWFSWNPRFPSDAVDELFRMSAGDPDVVCVSSTWQDNPWWTPELDAERRRDADLYPDQYRHVWLGEYVTVVNGAYFAQGLNEAKESGRIGNVPADPLMALRAYWDIGGSGAKADATAIWVVQFVGREIRVLDYYEAVGQPLAEHAQWLRDRGYSRAECVLPHDGANAEKVYAVTYSGALRAAGFSVRVMPNVGAGAAKIRIEAVRRILPACWFNESTTEAGRAALGWYHEKRDEHRGVGLGPEHDWSSHGADAFGLMAIDYDSAIPKKRKPIDVPKRWVI